MIHLRQTVLVCLLAAFAPAGSPLRAQEPPVITAHPLDRNAAYERSLRFGRIQSELVYIDRLEGEIPMDGAPPYRPPEPEPSRDAGQLDSMTVIGRVFLVAFALLAAWMLLRNVPAFRGRFGPRTPRARAPKPAPERQDPAAALPGADLLARLRAAHDREAALVELVRALLPVAADQNGLRIGRSETARELLRRLPTGWPHIADLRRIVMAEELVQFGGRALDAQRFEDCLDRAAPILAGPHRAGRRA